ncbi:1 transposase [Brachionus plicatilis]|uniref:1 transposase n=1 Tax=Brachionus plicatilis TaxID=10195 RepID=A0A3M7R4X0_BRAPC|nr:1 transposase [Brachionus plicatilis]
MYIDMSQLCPANIKQIRVPFDFLDDLVLKKIKKFTYYLNGKSVKDIIEILGGEVSRSSVYYWIEHLVQIPIPKPTCRRITKTTRKNKEKVKRLLSRYSGRFVSKYSRISQSSVVRICKDLNLKYRKIPFLNKSHIIGRKKFAVWWRKNHTELFGSAPFMFSDEKIFTVHGGMNSQNKRIYAYSREQAIRKGGINALLKYSTSVMVWAGLTIGGATRPYFIEKGE